MLNDEQLERKVRTVGAVRAAAAAATAKPTTPKQTEADKPMTQERWAQITAWSERELAKRAERERAAAGDFLTVGAAKPQPAAIPTKKRIVIENGAPVVKDDVLDMEAMSKATIARLRTADGRPSQQVHH